MMEWKKLGELGRFENIGTDKKIVEGEKLVTLLNYVDVYHHKYINISVPQMQVSASNKKIEDCTVEQGDIFVTPSSETVDDIGHSSVITETIPNAVYSYHIMRYRLFEKNMLLSYYINYSFDTDIVKKQILKKAQGLTRFGLSKDKFASIQIPIPSLPEQKRIVGILDTFTASIENLKEQISQRRKQYNWLLDKLYFATKAELLKASQTGKTIVKSFDEIGTFTRGRRFVRTDIVPEGVPCIHYGDMYTYYGVSAEDTPTHLTKELSAKLRFAKTGDVVIVGAGENDLDIGVGVAWLGKDPVVVHDACYIFEHNMNPKYLSYYMRSMNYHQQIRMGVVDGKICSISAKELGRTLIAVPSLDEQQRIVSILDTFEASIQNLEAQLSQREKQYEYYRNKLLTFD